MNQPFLLKIKWYGRALGALIYTTVMLIVLLQPESSPIIPVIPPPGQSIGREILFSTIHFLAFGCLSALWYWTFRSWHQAKGAAIIAFCIAVTLGLTSESLQSLVPGRNVQFIDLVANVSGSLLGLYLVQNIRRFLPNAYKSRPQKSP